MFDFLTNGMYGRLDTILVGWAIGLLWIFGAALVKGSGLRGKVSHFFTQEEFLFGNWGKTIRFQIGGWLFLIAVVALQFDTFFLNSLIRDMQLEWVSRLSILLDYIYCWSLVLKLIFFTKYSGKQLTAGFCFFFILRWVYLNNHVYWMILGVLFMLAAKDAPLRRTLNAGFLVSLISFIAVVSGSITGKIGTLYTEDFQGSGRARDSFGYGWYNMTGALLLSLCIMYVCWRRLDRFKWYDFGVLVAAFAFCQYRVNSRAAAVCILLLIVLSFFFACWPKIVRPLVIRIILALSPIVACGLSLWACWNYNTEEQIYQTIDKMVTGRLYLGHVALSQIHLAIAGQGLWNESFVIDNYYVYLWIYAGPVVSALFWGATALLLAKLLKKGSVTESSCIIAMLAHAVMECHFIWPSINITLWLLPSAIYLISWRKACDFSPAKIS